MQLVYFSPVPWASFAQRPHKFVEWFHARCGAIVDGCERDDFHHKGGYFFASTFPELGFEMKTLMETCLLTLHIFQAIFGQ